MTILAMATCVGKKPVKTVQTVVQVCGHSGVYWHVTSGGLGMNFYFQSHNPESEQNTNKAF